MKKTLVSGVLAIGLIINPIASTLTPTDVEASSVTKLNATGVVNTKSGPLTVRQSYSTSSKSIGSVKKGSTVTIIAEKNGWYQIYYEKSTGWVSGTYIKLNTQSAAPATSANKDYINYVNFKIDGQSPKNFIPSILRNGSTYISIRDIIPYFPKTELYYENNIILLLVNKNDRKTTATIDLNRANSGNPYLAVEHHLSGTKNMIPINDGKAANTKKPIVYNGKTYVNINDINKIFMTSANWDSKTNTVSISYTGQSFTYEDSQTKKTYVYLNHHEALKMYNELSKKRKSDEDLSKSFYVGVDVGAVIYGVITKAPVARAITLVGAGLVEGVLPPNPIELGTSMVLNLRHKDYNTLHSLLGTLEYQGRGVYFEIDSNKKIVGSVKQQ